MQDRDILIGSKAWSTTPWNYSSMRFIQFAAEGSGLLVYGYGQTIYAKIDFRYAVRPARQIEIEYLESPSFQCFAGFTPETGNSTKTLAYDLTQHQEAITEDVTGAQFSFKWLLTLDQSPFPEALTFPYDTPLKFYGYREDLRSEQAD